MTQRFEIGAIAGAQGLKGDVRVFPATDDPARFDGMAAADVTLGGRLTRLALERVWHRPPFVVLKFEGVNDRNAAEALKGGVITVDRKDAVPLAADEYYVADLIGLDVLTEDGERLGEILKVITTGANDVYQIENHDTGEELLLPAIKQCVLHVDIAGGAVTVRLLPGLRDVYREAAR